MTHLETQNRFVGLRAEGWSFDRIAQELGVSKPTLIDWSRKYQLETPLSRLTFVVTFVVETLGCDRYGSGPWSSVLSPQCSVRPRFSALRVRVSASGVSLIQHLYE